MQCECGAELRENDRFCSSCGQSVPARAALSVGANAPSPKMASPGISQPLPISTAPQTIDGWGDFRMEDAFAGLSPTPQPTASADSVPATPSDTSPRRIAAPSPLRLRWETLDVVREWPGKVIHNPSGVSLGTIDEAILQEIATREYAINKFAVTIASVLDRNKHYERSCLALSSSKHEQLREMYLLVQSEIEGKDIVLGLCLLRHNALKELCNGDLSDITRRTYGVEGSFNWNNKEKVMELTSAFVQDFAAGFDQLPRDFSIREFAIGELLEKRRILGKELMEKKNQMQEQLSQQQNVLAELQQRGKESEEKHNSSVTVLSGKQKSAATQAADARKNAEKLPLRVGWGAFGIFVLLALLSQSGGVFALGILIGPLAGLITKGITALERNNTASAEAACNHALTKESEAWSKWQSEQYQQVSRQQSVINSAQQTMKEVETNFQRSISDVEIQIKKRISDKLFSKAAQAFTTEDRWFGQRPADPALDRFVQVTINLINEVQLRIFPNTPPFKLIGYE